jgi:hypothetical protein
MGIRKLEHREDIPAPERVASPSGHVISVVRDAVSATTPDIIPFPVERALRVDHVTVEMEYRGDFRWEKDRFSYVLRALDLE